MILFIFSQFLQENYGMASQIASRCFLSCLLGSLFTRHRTRGTGPITDTHSFFDRSYYPLRRASHILL